MNHWASWIFFTVKALERTFTRHLTLNKQKKILAKAARSLLSGYTVR